MIKVRCERNIIEIMTQIRLRKSRGNRLHFEQSIDSTRVSSFIATYIKMQYIYFTIHILT